MINALDHYGAEVRSATNLSSSKKRIPQQRTLKSQVFLSIFLVGCTLSGIEAFLPTVPSSRTPFIIRYHETIRVRNPALMASEYDASDMFDDVPLSGSDLQSLTVNELKQQLRLRGEKVSGNKSELIDRLLGGVKATDSKMDETSEGKKKSEATEFAESRGKELIDVAEYLEEGDIGKETKTVKGESDDLEESDDSNSKKDSSPETWGSEAKIVDDYGGRSVVVDGMSRTVVEFKGSNQKPVKAYVVASRDSLKNYLAGGDRGNNATDLETAMRNIQTAREKTSKVPMRMEDVQGEDVDDEEGHYKNILDRDYGDWGKYSMTGVQLSAQEVKGVLLLSDVYGPFSDDTQMLADKIAFECQPAIVFAPDLFRGDPWKEDESNPGFNANGKSYEEWRACHPDERVSVDIRAAAAALREQYGASSISLFGTCYGGGRALEATARVYPKGTMNDVNDEEGPAHVDPSTCIAWYPTRYNAEALFGSKSKSFHNENRVETAVMAIFAGNDKLPSATPEDAAILKECLENDAYVKDNMVKVFADQEHGFAHIGMSKEIEEEADPFLDAEFGEMPSVSMGDADAEVASLLSTAWVDTYARQFLPTMGEAVKDDASWSGIEMPDLSDSAKRDIRAEIDEAIKEHKDEDLDLKRMHPDDFKTPMDDLEDMDENLYKALKTQPYGASLEDDADAFLDKLEAAIDRDDFASLPGFGEIPLDDSVDGPAYW